MPSVCDARVNSQRTGRHIVIALATLTVFAISTGSVHAQAEKTRPRIALALGGGAARGIAHVGVLQWLEEHRIPVDVVVGTSMGGLIGGAYASGMSPAEIRTFLATTDWDLIFLGETPYQYRDLRRREDRRIYPMRVEFGLKGGFKLPPGLDNGQQVTFLLQRIALPYYAVSSFDELPTPFRCVATDMEKGEPVVLGSGLLARAMRATMSLPTAFAPIVIDGRLLADGGILNNVPVDVARAQGADVVIAVNVGSTPHTREQMMSLFGMLGQTLDVAMSDSSRAIAATADVLVQPAVGGIGSLDFRRSEEIADLGYQGASEVTALLKYAVDDATWSQWVKARAARRKIDPPVPEFARIVGVGDKVDTTAMAEGLERFFGKPLDQEAIGQALTRITGDGLYSAVTYDAIRENGRDGLLVHVDEKLTGPPLLNVALEVSNRASKGLSFDPAFRVTMFNTLTKNSELRLDGSAGTRLGVSAEYYQRFGLSRYFLAPSIAAERRITEYFVNGEALAEYQARRYNVGGDAGVRLNADTELRAGYLYGRVDLERGIGSDILPEFGGLERRTHILVRHDSQTSPFAPTGGLLGGVEYRTGITIRFGRAASASSRAGRRSSIPCAAGIVCSCSSAAGRRLARQRRFPTSSRSADCSGCPATRTMSFEGTTIFLPVRATCVVSVGCRTSSAAGCMRRWSSMRDRRLTRGIRHRDRPALARDSRWTRSSVRCRRRLRSTWTADRDSFF